jgi:hypothetical protein
MQPDTDTRIPITIVAAADGYRIVKPSGTVQYFGGGCNRAMWVIVHNWVRKHADPADPNSRYRLVDPLIP